MDPDTQVDPAFHSEGMNVLESRRRRGGSGSISGKGAICTFSILVLVHLRQQLTNSLQWAYAHASLPLQIVYRSDQLLSVK